MHRLLSDQGCLLTDHGMYEFLNPRMAVAIAHFPNLVGLLRDRDLIYWIDAPTPRHVGNIVDAIPRASKVPVDECDRVTVLEQGVCRARIAMGDAFLSVGERMPRGYVMEITEHSGTQLGCATRTLAWVIRNAAGDVREDVPTSLVNAKVSRRKGIPDGLQIPQQRRYIRRVRAPSPSDRRADAYNLIRQVATSEGLLIHGLHHGGGTTLLPSRPPDRLDQLQAAKETELWGGHWAFAAFAGICAATAVIATASRGVRKMRPLEELQADRTRGHRRPAEPA